MPDEEYNRHTPKIAVMEKDISQIIGLFQKLDTTIDKLSEVSSSIKQMIAIHEIRINQQDKMNDKVVSDFKEFNKDLEDIKSRVSSLENWRWWGAGIVTVVVTGVTWALTGLKFLLP